MASGPSSGQLSVTSSPMAVSWRRSACTVGCGRWRMTARAVPRFGVRIGRLMTPPAGRAGAVGEQSGEFLDRDIGGGFVRGAEAGVAGPAVDTAEIGSGGDQPFGG